MSAHYLDEIVLASKSDVDRAGHGFAINISSSVGSIVEYELHRKFNRADLPRLSTYTSSPIVNKIELLANGGQLPISYSLQATEVDAIAIPRNLSHQPNWTAFVKRAEVSALAAGFEDQVAIGLSGAIGELADNIMQHSKAEDSGIAAFAQTSNGFEYVVADSGIGILNSFRQAAEFQSIRDDIEAMEMATTAGVSRHGRGSRRGFGYRAVLLPLRVAEGIIRMRSGKAVLDIVGSGIKANQIGGSQRPTHQGLVISVKLNHNL